VNCLSTNNVPALEILSKSTPAIITNFLPPIFAVIVAVKSQAAVISFPLLMVVEFVVPIMSQFGATTSLIAAT
jgi:hypothetical protein